MSHHISQMLYTVLTLMDEDSPELCSVLPQGIPTEKEKGDGDQPCTEAGPKAPYSSPELHRPAGVPFRPCCSTILAWSSLHSCKPAGGVTCAGVVASWAFVAQADGGAALLDGTLVFSWLKQRSPAIKILTEI